MHSIGYDGYGDSRSTQLPEGFATTARQRRSNNGPKLVTVFAFSYGVIQPAGLSLCWRLVRAPIAATRTKPRHIQSVTLPGALAMMIPAPRVGTSATSNTGENEPASFAPDHEPQRRRQRR
jgi:hypothetical protein